MPPDALARLLAETPFAWKREPRVLPALTDIQWRDDACGPGSILFFQRLDDGRSDEALYRRYLAGRPFAALVVNRPLDCFDALGDKAVYVTGEGEWPRVLARFCDLVYPFGARPPQFVGVTGTNGKTTTVKYLESILAAQGRRVLAIGTLGLFAAGRRLAETGFTSPPLIELRRLLHTHGGQADTVVMEVSSHALHQHRVYGIPLLSAGWTNFTQDHLDYHRTDDAYFAAKSMILDLIREDGRLFVASAAVAERILGAGSCRVPIELLAPAALAPEALAAKPFLALEHNRANYALAAALGGELLGRDPGADWWRHLSPVDGRFDCRVVGRFTVVVDFAHTPDALGTILAAIRRAYPAARVLTLFGCGGDRDRGKRPLMGQAVAAGSDYAIVTSDNPRHEDPEAIVADILTGMPDGNREAVVERPAAVARLFDFLAERPAGEPWVALIAGKGHERYIDRGGVKTYYSDRDEVERNLRRLGWSEGTDGSANERK